MDTAQRHLSQMVAGLVAGTCAADWSEQTVDLVLAIARGLEDATELWESMLSGGPVLPDRVLRAALEWPLARVRQSAWALGRASAEEVVVALGSERSGLVRAAMIAAHDLPPAVVTAALLPMSKSAARALLDSPAASLHGWTRRIPVEVWLAVVVAVSADPGAFSAGAHAFIAAALKEPSMAPLAAASAEVRIDTRLKACASPHVSPEVTLSCLDALVTDWAGSRVPLTTEIIQALSGVLKRQALTLADLDVLDQVASGCCWLLSRDQVRFAAAVAKRRPGVVVTGGPLEQIAAATSTKELVDVLDRFPRSEVTELVVEAMLGSPWAGVEVVDALAARLEVSRILVVRSLKQFPAWLWDDVELGAEVACGSGAARRRFWSVAPERAKWGVYERIVSGDLVASETLWERIVVSTDVLPDLADRIPLRELAVRRPRDPWLAARILELTAQVCATPVGAALLGSMLDSEHTLGDALGILHAVDVTDLRDAKVRLVDR